MSRRTIRTAPRIPILLVPFIAAGLILLAIGYMVKFICEGIATLRASKRAKAASKPREAPQRPVKARKRPSPPMTPQEREDDELERRWEAQLRRNRTEGKSKPPVVRVGGKRVMGRVVDMDDLPTPEHSEPWPEWEAAGPPPDMVGATPF